MQVETTNTQLKFKWAGPGSGLWRAYQSLEGLSEIYRLSTICDGYFHEQEVNY